jgi:cytoskeletal protein CcmA (bactofilin family)
MSFFSGRRNQPQPEPEPQPAQYAVPAASPARDTRETSIPPAQPVGFETVIGASCTLEGSLVSTGNVRLDGTFTGSLDISGNVLVGETAKITADVSARNISIAGAVRGNVTGRKVQLLRTGRVWGDITAQALSTEEGAFIDGKISMVSKEDARPPTEPSRPQDGRIDDTPVSAEPDFLAATDEFDAAASTAEMPAEDEAVPADWADDPEAADEDDAPPDEPL